MTLLPHTPRPDKATLERLYAAGRVRAVMNAAGVSRSIAWRWCRAAGVAMTRRILTYRDDVFDVIDTEHKAYTLGLLVSDGYVVEGPGRYVVTLGSTDQEIPETFRALTGWSRPLYLIAPNPLQKRWMAEHRISVCSKKLVAALVALGVRQRKSTKEVSPLPLGHPLVHHFLRGVFDGDGSVGIYGDDRKALLGLVGSEAICRFFSAYFASQGLPEMSVRLKDGGLWATACGGNNLVPAVAELLYRDARHWLSRKREVVDLIPASKKIWRTAAFGRPAPKRLVNCDYCGQTLLRKAQCVHGHVFCSQKCWGRYYNASRCAEAPGQLHLF